MKIAVSRRCAIHTRKPKSNLDVLSPLARSLPTAPFKKQIGGQPSRYHPSKLGRRYWPTTAHSKLHPSLCFSRAYDGRRVFRCAWGPIVVRTHKNTTSPQIMCGRLVTWANDGKCIVNWHGFTIVSQLQIIPQEARLCAKRNTQRAWNCMKLLKKQVQTGMYVQPYNRGNLNTVKCIWFPALCGSKCMFVVYVPLCWFGLPVVQDLISIFWDVVDLLQATPPFWW